MDHTADLLRFLDGSPSPFHAVQEAAARLDAAGFDRVEEADLWPTGPGQRYLIRGGSLVAWAVPAQIDPAAGFRIVGAHTDSPNLRIKPRPDTGGHGWRQLGVEVYGGALWSTWLDRDLGLSGRVALRKETTPRLLQVDRPLLRIPNVAIHLDRTVNSEGLKLDPQRDLVPVWGAGEANDGDLARFVAEEFDVPADDLQGWDLMLHEVTPATLLGSDGDLVSSGRLDNLLSCWAATTALAEATATELEPDAPVPVVCLYDHEEVGSQSATGADSSLLPTTLERVALDAGLDRLDWHRSLAASYAVSADGAHATHPNRPDRHEPEHHVRIDGGPVLKHNANVRYATDALGASWLRQRAEDVEIPLQDFVVRSDIPCGSTIGPVTAARLGITTVDVGVSQLAMHSARELCGRHDAERFVPLLAACLQG